MNEDLSKIRSLINSKNNQNLFIGWTMLRQYKKFDRGEFRDIVRKAFLIKETKNRLEWCISTESGKIRLVIYEYKCPNWGDVFSMRLLISNIKHEHRKGIPVDSMEGVIKSRLNKIISYIDSLVERI